MKIGKRWGLGAGAGVCVAVWMLTACSGSDTGKSATPSGSDGGGATPSSSGGSGNAGAPGSGAGRGGGSAAGGRPGSDTDAGRADGGTAAGTTGGTTGGGTGGTTGAADGGAPGTGGFLPRGGAGGLVVPITLPGGNSDVPEPVPDVTRSRKVDLLIMVDNSISMADKQQALKITIPDLVSRLTAPASGVTDLHVGVITSSLGDHGDNDTCLGIDGTTIHDEEQNDHAHLITTRPRGVGLGIPDVISWDSTKSTTTLTKQIQDVVVAAGEFGCGLESQLESVYRFLVDPKPPLTVVKAPCSAGSTAQCAFQQGLDTVLLSQRAAFLRPDSTVAVVLLTDENDCSIREERQFFYAATSPTKILLPHGTAVCATNPNDPCCYSCGSSRPAACPVDPTCTPSTSSSKDDSLNLRCFHEKQRFGLDFLYPIERYLTAFTRSHLCTSSPTLEPNAAACRDLDLDGAPDIVQNPLFYGTNGTVRAASLVYVLGMVGVPWQELAQGGPGATTLALKPPATLAVDRTWNYVLGDPAASPPIDPADGLMLESRTPRAALDFKGTAIPGIGAPFPGVGHEWANTYNDDLEYACIFPLLAPRDCIVVEQQNPSPGCDCGEAFNAADNNPLCQSPSNGTYGHTQFFGKGYPGIRELSLLYALGSQGLTASVCPKNLTDDTKSDYGYRPAVDLLLGELKRAAP